MKAFFSRVGGKHFSSKKIVPLIPNHRIYVEPFVGAGSIFFRKEPSDIEIINDLDKDIYHLFTDIKKVSKEDVEKMNFKPSRSKFNYFLENNFTDPKKRFERNYYLSYNSFGGNRKGFGRLDKNGRNYNSSIADRVEEIQERLKGVKIRNRDYKEIIKKYDSKDTFFFLDPPYADTGGDYNHNDVPIEELFNTLKNIKGKFLMTYSNDRRIKKLFKNFKIRKFNVRYVRDSNNIETKEIMISNY